MVLAFGLALIAIGLVRIFLLDVAWEFAQFNHQRRGRKSERTSTWDGATIVSGIVCVIIGLIMSCSGAETLIAAIPIARQAIEF